PATASRTSSVNEIRSRHRSSTSPSPGSWIGTSPACSRSMRAGRTSRITTSWPRSAKHAPVTRPTHPAPKMPTLLIAREDYGCDRGRGSAPRDRGSGSRPTFPRASLVNALERLEALGDRDHRLVRERVEQRIHDPVGRAVPPQHDHVEVRARVVEVVGAAPDDAVEAAV